MKIIEQLTKAIQRAQQAQAEVERLTDELRLKIDGRGRKATGRPRKQPEAKSGQISKEPENAAQ